MDKEGFPIADVNLILSVREARNRLASTHCSRRVLLQLSLTGVAVLQTDFKTLTKEIEEKMIILHAKAREEREQKKKEDSIRATTMEKETDAALQEKTNDYSSASLRAFFCLLVI